MPKSNISTARMSGAAISKQSNGRSKRTNGSRNGNGNGTGITSGSTSHGVSLYRPINNSFTRISGSDFVTTVGLRASPNADERILATFPVSPSAYPGTRITQLSNLWERYRINKFHLRYVPAIPTSIACQILIYIDTDPQDDPLGLNVDALIRQATAQTGSCQWNAFTPRSVELAQRRDDQLYYTGISKQNERFNLQGKAFLIQVTDPVNFVGEPLGDDLPAAGAIYIDWDVSFQTPQINVETFFIPSSVAYELVEASADVNNQNEDIDLTGLVPFGRYILTLFLLEATGAYVPALVTIPISYRTRNRSQYLLAKRAVAGEEVYDDGDPAITATANQNGEIEIVKSAGNNGAWVNQSLVMVVTPFAGTPAITVDPLERKITCGGSTMPLRTVKRGAASPDTDVSADATPDIVVSRVDSLAHLGVPSNRFTDSISDR